MSTIERLTTRKATVDLGATVLVPNPYAALGTVFRVTSLVERLEETTETTRYGHPYRVVLYGPNQTAKGVDHARNRGQRVYEGDRLGEIPEAVRPYLVGADALREWTA